MKSAALNLFQVLNKIKPIIFKFFKRNENLIVCNKSLEIKTCLYWKCFWVNLLIVQLILICFIKTSNKLKTTKKRTKNSETTWKIQFELEFLELQRQKR